MHKILVFHLQSGYRTAAFHVSPTYLSILNVTTFLNCSSNGSMTTDTHTHNNLNLTVLIEALYVRIGEDPVGNPRTKGSDGKSDNCYEKKWAITDMIFNKPFANVVGNVVAHSSRMIKPVDNDKQKR